MNMWKTFRSAIVAGICIGIAGFGNLAVGVVVSFFRRGSILINNA